MTRRDTLELLAFILFIVLLISALWPVLGPWTNLVSIPVGVGGALLLARYHERRKERS